MAGTRGDCSAVLRTPEDREMHRRSLYKRHQLASWKETYRQRCAERLRTSRDKVLARFRGGFSGGASAHGLPCSDKSPNECKGMTMEQEMKENLHRVMGEEWEQLRGDLGLPSLPELTAEGRKRRRVDSDASESELKIPVLNEHQHSSTDSDDEFTTPPQVWRESCLSDDEYDTELDHILYTLDELTQQLLKEERTILDEYEDGEQFGEAALNAAIDALSVDPVVCPVCLKHVLHQNKHIVFCACGLRIDTAQDGITLDYVRRQLQDGSTLHSKLCSAPPVFVVEEVVNGLQNLVMNCPICDFLYIVL